MDETPISGLEQRFIGIWQSFKINFLLQKLVLISTHRDR